MVEHDKVSRNSIPSIYARTAYVSRIQQWPQGGIMAGRIGDKFIINNTNKTLYVCSQDGVIRAIPPLNDGVREGLLRQLYFSLGMKLDQKDVFIQRTIEQYILEPTPVVSFRDMARKEKYEISEWSVTTDMIPIFTKHYGEVNEKVNSSPQDILNILINKANEIDNVNRLTNALRRNEPSVWILTFMFEEPLKYGAGKCGDVPRIYNHVLRENFSPELFKMNFEMVSLSGDIVSAEEMFSQRYPCMVWTHTNLKSIERMHQGVYYPEHGLTISFCTDLSNKALSFTDPESDVYLGRTGLRILIPQRPAGVKVLYARIGKQVSKISCDISEDTDGNFALAYCFDANGDEVLAGKCHVDELLSKGMTMDTPDGPTWHIPFFSNRNEAISYLDPEDEALVGGLRGDISSLRKRLKDATIELDKIKEEKQKTVARTIISIITHNKVVSIITGALISLVTIIFTAWSSSK